MKDTGICPKCGSVDVVKIPGGPMSPLNSGGIIHVGLGMAGIDRWVCCACGYSEAWVEAEYLQRIREKWQKSR